ncbi:MAG TPA: NrfA- nitrite reduction protein [Thioploca sp.]|nr:NrfA- nitrite reduction protein [Thioploca sp.]
MLFKILNYKFTGLFFMLAVIGYLSVEMFGPNKQSFLPGKTSSAHHQIELACDLCHTPLDGVKQKACLDCHGDALKEASDSHAKKVFNDPRSYAMLEKINAKKCVSCHAEHLDTKNSGKTVSVPTDYCFACHDDIEEERPSHKGLSAEDCSASGCHNYHDNTALYEDFVKKHLDENSTLSSTVVPLRNIAELTRKKLPLIAAKNLSIKDQDASNLVPNIQIIKQWAKSGHAEAGVNCTHCHKTDDKTKGSVTAKWTDTPSLKVCEDCHTEEAKNFYKGKHGMRLAAGLSPMQPDLARIPMKQQAHDKKLTCNTCHFAHDYNTRKAAVSACLDCHDDTHSKAYITSPHYQLWLKELSGELPAGSGVSCATCHLPRLKIRKNGLNRILVNHNQNANLRPNSKMIRDVCLQCHGLAFSLQSLADSNLVLNNYSSSATEKHKTIDMVKNRAKK